MSLTATTLPYQRETLLQFDGGGGGERRGRGGGGRAAHDAATFRYRASRASRQDATTVTARRCRRPGRTGRRRSRWPGAEQPGADPADQGHRAGQAGQLAGGAGAAAIDQHAARPGAVIRKTATMPPAANARLPVTEATSRPMPANTTAQSRLYDQRGQRRRRTSAQTPDMPSVGGERRAQEHDRLRPAEQQPDRGDQGGDLGQRRSRRRAAAGRSTAAARRRAGRGRPARARRSRRTG